MIVLNKLFNKKGKKYVWKRNWGPGVERQTSDPRIAGLILPGVRFFCNGIDPHILLVLFASKGADIVLSWQKFDFNLTKE